MPGYLNATNNLFKIYKIPEGNPENTIAFDEQAQNKVIIKLIYYNYQLIIIIQTFATSIVLETHEHWQRLINGTTPRKEIQT